MTKKYAQNVLNGMILMSPVHGFVSGDRKIETFLKKPAKCEKVLSAINGCNFGRPDKSDGALFFALSEGGKSHI
jgi:hypothetical protein